MESYTECSDKLEKEAENQGWHYGTARLEFAYHVPRAFNGTVPTYRI